MRKPELLAPAGTMDSFKAAIMAGCDAVYLAGNAFGARAFAKNFSREELVEAIYMAHLYGVKVYVTVNTLIYDHEVEDFLEYIDFLHKHSVDAVIMQDLGMMDLVHQTYPLLEIHASTQMHIHTLKGVEFALKQGIKRVVLARETPISVIREVKEKCPMDIEIFVHGALCVSYSGQCLMSSLNGGRSGNRGSCVQCCRMPYDVVIEKDSGYEKVVSKTYPLSMKDLCTIEHISELIEAGVDSFKIEGRMKSPGYVYFVTSLYRKAIDQYFETGSISITEEDMLNLKVMFNRQFTKGFLFGEEKEKIVHTYRPNHMGIEVGKVVGYRHGRASILLSSKVSQGDGIRILNKKQDTGCNLNYIYFKKLLVNQGNVGDVIEIDVSSDVNVGDVVVKTSDYKLNSEIEKKMLHIDRKVNLTGCLKVYKDKPLELIFDDSVHKLSLFSDFIVQEAKNAAVSFERMKEQCTKLGDTIYSMADFEVVGDTDVFVPISVLNDLRRKVVEEMSQVRNYVLPYEMCKYERKVEDFPVVSKKRVFVHNLQQYELCKDLDVSFMTDDMDLCFKIPNCIYALPRVVNSYPNCSSGMVGEVGSLCYSSFSTDFSLNVTNSYTVAFLHSLGACSVTLSYELSDDQIVYLIECYKKRYHAHPCLEKLVYGYMESMITKYSLVDYYGLHNQKVYLKDEKGNLFPVVKKDNYNLIYHDKILKMDDYSIYFDMGISYVRFDLELCTNFKEFLNIVSL